MATRRTTETILWPGTTTIKRTPITPHLGLSPLSRPEDNSREVSPLNILSPPPRFDTGELRITGKTTTDWTLLESTWQDDRTRPDTWQLRAIEPHFAPQCDPPTKSGHDQLMAKVTKEKKARLRSRHDRVVVGDPSKLKLHFINNFILWLSFKILQDEVLLEAKYFKILQAELLLEEKYFKILQAEVLLEAKYFNWLMTWNT